MRQVDHSLEVGRLGALTDQKMLRMTQIHPPSRRRPAGGGPNNRVEPARRSADTLVRRRRVSLGLAVVVGALVLVGALSSSAIAAPEVASGATLYKTYCASCHGTEARGNGPVAAAMRSRPPDLTQLARGNSGLFPADRVRRIVDGREVESHGTRDMPVWGDVFRRLGSEADGDASARIAAIVGFLESIQQRNAH